MSINLLSYRGPGNSGGVSSGLECLWRTESAKADSSWWFLSDKSLEKISSVSGSSEFIALIPEKVVAGHYRYCNDFLWPVLHDLDQYAKYDLVDREHYRHFNQMFANYIGYEHQGKDRYFVQDYQLALLPRFLNTFGAQSNVFWHIPWPKNIRAEFVEPLTEIAQGLLQSRVVGFHTEEYAHNFAEFIAEYLPRYSISDDLFVERYAESEEYDPRSAYVVSNNYITRPIIQPYFGGIGGHTRVALAGTQILVQPLGIDIEHWNNLQSSFIDMSKFAKTPVVLSVDRADYSKSVYERLGIVDRFFEKYRDQIGNLTFVQICHRTRSGLKAFDDYWNACQQKYQEVNKRWATDSWQPVNWVEDAIEHNDLAALYRQAEIMLVNPIRDGLNLTAKEYVACQDNDPGVLLLSPGAGAWHEIGNFALPADPTEPNLVVNKLAQALKMTRAERMVRNDLIIEQLSKNPLPKWWARMTRSLIPGKARKTIQIKKSA
jgi:trehalose 6-phosphate synthase